MNELVHLYEWACLYSKHNWICKIEWYAGGETWPLMPVTVALDDDGMSGSVLLIYRFFWHDKCPAWASVTTDWDIRSLEQNSESTMQ